MIRSYLNISISINFKPIMYYVRVLCMCFVYCVVYVFYIKKNLINISCTTFLMDQ